MGLGQGVLRGMGLTLRHFVQSFTVGRKEQPSVAGGVALPPRQLKGGMPLHLGGIITAQYPDEKLPVPERFRYLPFLVFEEGADGERAAFDGIRCTACGICARVCPPQCIFIKQAKGGDGRARPVPTEYCIDASICMSCGLCVEYCPFDAIKMNHDFELSSYERRESWVLDLQSLLHPLAYHAAIHPEEYAREIAERRAKAEARRLREAAAAGAQSATGTGGAKPTPAAAKGP
jgi:NADH-quinone oxidoreductase subunit I